MKRGDGSIIGSVHTVFWVTSPRPQRQYSPRLNSLLSTITEGRLPLCGLPNRKICCRTITSRWAGASLRYIPAFRASDLKIVIFWTGLWGIIDNGNLIVRFRGEKWPTRHASLPLIRVSFMRKGFGRYARLSYGANARFMRCLRKRKTTYMWLNTLDKETSLL